MRRHSDTRSVTWPLRQIYSRTSGLPLTIRPQAKLLDKRSTLPRGGNTISGERPTRGHYSGLCSRPLVLPGPRPAAGEEPPAARRPSRLGHRGRKDRMKERTRGSRRDTVAPKKVSLGSAAPPDPAPEFRKSVIIFPLRKLRQPSLGESLLKTHSL